MNEISLLIGIICSLLLIAISGKLNKKDYKTIVFRMKPWKYFLIIIAVFLFLHIFQATSVSEELSKIVFSKSFLIIFIGAFLSLVTGRVQVPVSILIPIFVGTYGAAELTPLTFAIMYVAVYLGYMISPVHPCVSVSLEFFGAKYKDFTGKLLLPSLIGFGCVFWAAVVLL
jgi:hypothetical protein